MEKCKAGIASVSVFSATLLSESNKIEPLLMSLQLSDPSERSIEIDEVSAIFRPKFDSGGMLTAVIADAEDGAVLMVGFMDAEALQATRSTGLVHFHSRSRNKLWQKGETSGHVLRVAEILVDCDQDALLIRAMPAGPTCHTGRRSCFYRRLEDDHFAEV